MSMTDPIADMFTRIRNAILAKHERVNIPLSNTKKQITQILKEEGYISNYRITKSDNHKNIRIYLKYVDQGTNAIYGIKRVSKPGCRVYVGKDDIPVVLNGLGSSIISTSQGLLSGRGCKARGVGGEVVCYLW